MTRTTAPALTLVLALAGALLWAAPARAAGALPPPGAPLGVTAPQGNDAAIVSLTTAGPCPAGTTHVHAQLFGGALPDDGQVLRDVSAVGFSTTAAFSTEASRTLRDVFATAGVASAPGEYVVELLCTDALLTRRASSTATLTFTSSATYASDPRAPQRTDATWAAGDGSVPRDLGTAADDASASTSPVVPPVAPEVQGDSDAAPLGAAAAGSATPPPPPAAAGRTQPVAATVDGDAGTSTVLAAAALGAGIATALALGVPAALRRRRRPPVDAPARELAAAGRAGR